LKSLASQAAGKAGCAGLWAQLYATAELLNYVARESSSSPVVDAHHRLLAGVRSGVSLLASEAELANDPRRKAGPRSVLEGRARARVTARGERRNECSHDFAWVAERVWSGARKPDSLCDVRRQGFVLLASYLSGTWMFRLMPETYYLWDGGICVKHVIMQLMINDFLQTLMHLGEHKLSAWVYRKSHKPHHRFLSPKMFDAFNGSVTDTVFMILVPLFITAQSVHCNVWSYMAFGSIFAGWLTLIHSEMQHPWDPLFQKIGLGILHIPSCLRRP
jgi:hypothetical protein